MGKPKRYRLDTLVENLIRKDSIIEQLTRVRENFQPFRTSIKSVLDFEIWLDTIRKKGGYENSSKEKIFLDAIDSISHYLKNQEGLFARNLDNRLVEQSLFGKLPPKSKTFGISHYIDENPYEDGYAKLEIYVDPGVSKKEFYNYINENWGKWEKRWRKLTWNDDRLLKRIRVKSNALRDQKIINLHQKGYSDQYICAELKLDGKLSLVRKVISRNKKINRDI